MNLENIMLKWWKFLNKIRAWKEGEGRGGNSRTINLSMYKLIVEITFPFLRKKKISPVAASWIILRNLRWIHRKWIYSVCIDRLIKSMHLPIGRNCFNFKKKKAKSIRYRRWPIVVIGTSTSLSKDLELQTSMICKTKEKHQRSKQKS